MKNKMIHFIERLISMGLKIEYNKTFGKNLLIDDIGFNGVIISDDFDMGAIRNNYSLREITVNAINAGVDILLFSNNIKTYDIEIAKKIKDIIKEEIKLK